jgi:putative peptide zinc metalloprotease protein
VTRKLILLLSLLAFALGTPGLAHAGGDTSAVAINTKDGSSLFKFAFGIKKVLGDVVDNQNAAVSFASCESCRTTAISIQIVLVVGSPTTVIPENYAISINQDCNLCQTFSSAYQFVIGVSDASVGLSTAGRMELLEILRDFKALKEEDYTAAEFKERTDALAERLRAVLRNELVSRSDGAGDDLYDETQEDERPAPPAPATTENATSEPETTTAETFTESVPAPTTTTTETTTATTTETTTDTTATTETTTTP